MLSVALEYLKIREKDDSSVPMCLGRECKCVHGCVFVHMCTQMCVCACCVCVHVGHLLIWVSSSVFLHLLFKTGFLTEPAGWLASELQRLSRASPGLDCSHISPTCLLTCLGVELRSLSLHGEHFTKWAISPATLPLYFLKIACLFEVSYVPIQIGRLFFVLSCFLFL